MISFFFNSTPTAKQKIAKDPEGAAKALRATFSDLRSRGPAQVSKAVREVYNIRAGEIKPGGGRKAGNMKVQAMGTTVADFTLVYTGEVLSTGKEGRFNMSPSAHSFTPYTVKATIMKGHRETIGKWSPRYSQGGAYARPGESPYFLSPKGNPLLMKRVGDDDWRAFRTLSVPQMVGNERVGPKVLENLTELVDKRLEHNLDRFIN